MGRSSLRGLFDGGQERVKTEILFRPHSIWVSRRHVGTRHGPPCLVGREKEDHGVCHSVEGRYVGDTGSTYLDGSRGWLYTVLLWYSCVGVRSCRTVPERFRTHWGGLGWGGGPWWGRRNTGPVYLEAGKGLTWREVRSDRGLKRSGPRFGFIPRGRPLSLQPGEGCPGWWSRVPPVRWGLVTGGLFTGPTVGPVFRPGPRGRPPLARRLLDRVLDPFPVSSVSGTRV